MILRTIPCGSLLGISLRVHPLLFGLLGGVLWLRREDPRTLPLMSGAVISLLLHELGHARMARRQGIPVAAIVLGPLTNRAWLVRVPELVHAEGKIALAGPAVNGVLAALLALLTWALSSFTPLEPGTRASLEGWIWINLALGLGNLLPVLPLDGGRALRSALTRRMTYAQATHAAARVGRVTSLLAPPLLCASRPSLRTPMGVVVTALVMLTLALSCSRAEAFDLEEHAEE